MIAPHAIRYLNTGTVHALAIWLPNAPNPAFGIGVLCGREFPAGHWEYRPDAELTCQSCIDITAARERAE